MGKCISKLVRPADNSVSEKKKSIDDGVPLLKRSDRSLQLLFHKEEDDTNGHLKVIPEEESPAEEQYPHQDSAQNAEKPTAAVGTALETIVESKSPEEKAEGQEEEGPKAEDSIEVEKKEDAGSDEKGTQCEIAKVDNAHAVQEANESEAAAIDKEERPSTPEISESKSTLGEIPLLQEADTQLIQDSDTQLKESDAGNFEVEPNAQDIELTATEDDAEEWKNAEAIDLVEDSEKFELIIKQISESKSTLGEIALLQEADTQLLQDSDTQLKESDSGNFEVEPNAQDIELTATEDDAEEWKNAEAIDLVKEDSEKFELIIKQVSESKSTLVELPPLLLQEADSQQLLQDSGTQLKESSDAENLEVEPNAQEIELTAAEDDDEDWKSAEASNLVKEDSEKFELIIKQISDKFEIAGIPDLYVDALEEAPKEAQQLAAEETKADDSETRGNLEKTDDGASVEAEAVVGIGELQHDEAPVGSGIQEKPEEQEAVVEPESGVSATDLQHPVEDEAQSEWIAVSTAEDSNSSSDETFEKTDRASVEAEAVVSGELEHDEAPVEEIEETREIEERTEEDEALGNFISATDSQQEEASVEEHAKKDASCDMELQDEGEQQSECIAVATADEAATEEVAESMESHEKHEHGDESGDENILDEDRRPETAVEDGKASTEATDAVQQEQEAETQGSESSPEFNALEEPASAAETKDISKEASEPNPRHETGGENESLHAEAVEQHAAIQQSCALEEPAVAAGTSEDNNKAAESQVEPQNMPSSSSTDTQTDGMENLDQTGQKEDDTESSDSAQGSQHAGKEGADSCRQQIAADIEKIVASEGDRVLPCTKAAGLGF